MGGKLPEKEVWRALCSKTHMGEIPIHAEPIQIQDLMAKQVVSYKVFLPYD